MRKEPTRQVSGVFLPVDVIDSEAGIGLVALLRAARRRAMLIIVAALVLGAGSWLLSWCVTPKYRAVIAASVQANDPMNSASGLGSVAMSGLAAVAGIDVGKNDKVKDAMALLQSDAFSARFIEANDAMPVLFPESWEATKRAWKKTPPTLNAAIKRFARKVRKVQWDSETGLLSVEVTLPDRALAANWANKLVEQVNNESRQRTIEDAKLSVVFLKRQLQETPIVEVQNAIYRMIENQVKTEMLANVRKDYLLRVIDPARTADEGSYFYPPRLIIGLLGGMLGVLIGFSVAVFDLLRSSSVSASSAE